MRKCLSFSVPPIVLSTERLLLSWFHFKLYLQSWQDLVLSSEHPAVPALVPRYFVEAAITRDCYHQGGSASAIGPLLFGFSVPGYSVTDHDSSSCKSQSNCVEMNSCFDLSDALSLEWITLATEAGMHLHMRQIACKRPRHGSAPLELLTGETKAATG